MPHGATRAVARTVYAESPMGDTTVSGTTPTGHQLHGLIIERKESGARRNRRVGPGRRRSFTVGASGRKPEVIVDVQTDAIGRVEMWRGGFR